MNGPRRGLPRQASPVAIELESVGKIFGLLPCPYELDNGKELLMTVEFFLLLQHEHEMVSEATLHHDPIHGSGQINIGGEEDDILALECGDALVDLHEMRHDLLERALPFTRGPWTRTRVRPKLTGLLMIELLCMEEGGATTRALIATREHDGGGHLFHGQIANVPAKLTAASGATREFGATRRAHQVTRMTLQYGG